MEIKTLNPKENQPKYSLEGLMLKLKLQYFGHLMLTADSVEKALMQGKIEGWRRKGWQRMSCLDGITDSVYVLSHFSRVWLFETLWTVVCHAPLSIGFSRQENWSGLLNPSLGDLSDPGIKSWSPALRANSSLSELPGKPQWTWVWKISRR